MWNNTLDCCSFLEMWDSRMWNTMLDCCSLLEIWYSEIWNTKLACCSLLQTRDSRKWKHVMWCSMFYKYKNLRNEDMLSYFVLLEGWNFRKWKQVGLFWRRLDYAICVLAKTHFDARWKFSQAGRVMLAVAVWICPLFRLCDIVFAVLLDNSNAVVLPGCKNTPICVCLKLIHIISCACVCV